MRKAVTHCTYVRFFTVYGSAYECRLLPTSTAGSRDGVPAPRAGGRTRSAADDDTTQIRTHAHDILPLHSTAYRPLYTLLAPRIPISMHTQIVSTF